jgi:curved DNA-binding protein CbpA
MAAGDLSLTGRPLANIVSAFSRERFTGTLAVFGDQVGRFFLFVSGELRAARSNAEQEKMGSWLVHREFLSDEQKNSFLEELHAGGVAPSFGHLMINAGLIDQVTLDRQLQDLAFEIIRRAAAEGSPEIQFYEGHEGPLPWDTLPDLDTQQLVLEIARLFPDEKAKRRALEPFDQLVAVAKKLDDIFLELKLEPTEAFLLSRIGGTQTIRELTTSAGLSEDAAIGAMYALKSAGLVAGAKARVDASEETESPATEEETSESGPDISAMDDDQRSEREEITALAGQVMSLNHYQALDLDLGAGDEKIKRAWLRYKVTFNPERSSDSHLSDLEEQLKAIYERAEHAYEVLSSPDLRQRYDRICGREDDTVEAEVEESRRKQAQQEVVAANLRRADELARQGDFYAAIELVKTAAELEPRASTFVFLGRLLGRNSKLTRQALGALRQATELDQRCVDAWLEIAAIWQRRKQNERQRKALERALAADPTNVKVHVLYRQEFGEKHLASALKRFQH